MASSLSEGRHFFTNRKRCLHLSEAEQLSFAIDTGTLGGLAAVLQGCVLLVLHLAVPLALETIDFCHGFLLSVKVCIAVLDHSRTAAGSQLALARE